MAYATDDLLLLLYPGLAKPQIVEFWISAAADVNYKIGIGDHQYSYAAVGKTIAEIRDGLFDAIVPAEIDPIVASPKVDDRIKVKGTPGDPFEYWALPLAQIQAIEVQPASGLSTALRLLILQTAALLVPPDPWGDKQAMGHAYLALYFLGKHGKIFADGASGQASSMSLGPASVSLTMPTDAELMADPAGWGGLYLALYNSISAGPIWS